MNFYPLSSLLDAQRGAFLFDVKMPDADAEKHYNYICLVDGGSEEGKILYGVYLISDDEYIEELENDLLAWGYKVTWEYADEEDMAQNTPQAYILHVIDQDGRPVEQVSVTFCTDAACVPRESDENGLITFTGAPDIYHMQIVDVPDGYSWDEDFEMYTAREYCEWILRIRKD